MATKNAGRVELARRVTGARSRLYETVEKARLAANVSRGAWDNVEDENGTTPQDFTLGKIEKALGWPQGFALAILEGRAADEPPAVTSLREHVTNSTVSPEVKRAILALLDSDPRNGGDDDGADAAPIAT